MPRKKHYFKIGEIVNEELKIIEHIRKGKVNKKYYVVQSMVFLEAPKYEVSESSLIQGRKCAYKSGLRIFEGNSLYSIEETRANIINIEEAKKTAIKSNKKMDFKCSECGYVKNMQVSKLTNRGFSCPNCNKKTSYGELFILSYLQIKNIKFKYQYRDSSLENRIFDFYLPEEDIYLEVMGEQHYKKNNSWHKTAIDQDKDKKEWAKRNNKKLLMLDCRESNFEFIKNNINNSVLPPIINEEEENIIKTINKNRHYPIKKLEEYYKKHRTFAGVEQIFNISPATAYKIFRNSGNKTLSKRRKVRCLNNGRVFSSVTEATRYANIKSTSSIPNVCKGKCKYAGELNGERLQWEYVDFE